MDIGKVKYQNFDKSHNNHSYKYLEDLEMTRIAYGPEKEEQITFVQLKGIVVEKVP